MALPGDVTVFLVVMYLSAISGFLHLDGLADSADGLLSARPRERSLEIMKDSRTGAMGVVMLILVVLGKYAALTAMPFEKVALAVFCLPLAGRTAILFTMAIHRYARQEGGLGGLFYSSRTRYAALAGVALLLPATWAVGGLGTATVVLGVTAFTVFWFGNFCKARLGGVTGDTLGAVCELTEMSVAIGLTAIL
jgi:adenosylcobinamide-GDP ribazoletransferase